MLNGKTSPTSVTYQRNETKIYWNWNWLSGNPNAIQLLKKNPDKIDWTCLSGNPNAINLLQQTPDKINWRWLSGNPNAIHLLEKNLDKIIWERLSENPSIFEIDYNLLRERCSIYKEELIQVAMHPSRIEKYLEQGISIEELYDYI